MQAEPLDTYSWWRLGYIYTTINCLSEASRALRFAFHVNRLHKFDQPLDPLAHNVLKYLVEVAC